LLLKNESENGAWPLAATRNSTYRVRHFSVGSGMSLEESGTQGQGSVACWLQTR